MNQGIGIAISAEGRNAVEGDSCSRRRAAGGSGVRRAARDVQAAVEVAKGIRAPGVAARDPVPGNVSNQ